MQTDDDIFEFWRNNFGLETAVRSMNTVYQIRHTIRSQRDLFEMTSQPPQPIRVVSSLSIETESLECNEMYDPDILREVDDKTDQSFVDPKEKKIKYMCNYCPSSYRKQFASTCGVRKHCRKDHKEQIQGTNGKVYLYCTPVNY